MADEIKNLDATVEEAEDALAKAEAAATKARSAVEAAQAIRDAAIIERDGQPDPNQDQIDRMAYIRSQAEQRAQRADFTEQLRSIFPDGELPQNRSPLDAAMKGSRKRGTARPKKDG